MGYTDSTMRLEEEADVVIRVMRDLFSPITTDVPRPGLDGMTALLTSEERQLQSSDLSALDLELGGRDTRRHSSTLDSVLGT